MKHPVAPRFLAWAVLGVLIQSVFPGTARGDSIPVITTQPQSLTVTNGDAASFTVVASGSPAPTYQWRKNGAALSGATLAAYSITAATTNDAGGYDVVVSNSSGSVTSSLPATLTVLVPPRITTQPRSLTVTNGFNANLAVVATGFPAPSRALSTRPFAFIRVIRGRSNGQPPFASDNFPALCRATVFYDDRF